MRTFYRNVRIDSRGHVAQRPLLLFFLALSLSASGPSFSTPNRTKSSLPSPLSADESTPWHPTAFANSATQGNQDGYRVSTLRLPGDRSDVSIRGNISECNPFGNLICLQFRHVTSDAYLFLKMEKMRFQQWFMRNLSQVFWKNFKRLFRELYYFKNIICGYILFW